VAPELVEKQGARNRFGESVPRTLVLLRYVMVVGRSGTQERFDRRAGRGRTNTPEVFATVRVAWGASSERPFFDAVPANILEERISQKHQHDMVMPTTP
jgi:hypothetical protein